MEDLNNGVAHVAVDPQRGGSIMHFGRTADQADNVLARYQWDSPPPPADGYKTSQQDWLSRYRGGWQLLAPNAGAESTVAGVHHPFHGEVSTACWQVVERDQVTLTMRTATRGSLVVTRSIELHPGQPRLTVHTTLLNPTPVAAHAVLVEHIALANDDDARVVAPSGSQWEFDPASPGHDGRRAAWERSPMRTPVEFGRWRVGSLVDGSEGWVELHRLGGGVRVTWDHSKLPYLWYWQERGTQQFPFFGRADITGLEPSSTKFSDGLASAIDRNEAWTIEGGKAVTTSVTIEILTREP